MSCMPLYTRAKLHACLYQRVVPPLTIWGLLQIVLGFWPVLWDIVERRGRLNSHLMIDYSLTYMVFSICLSLLLGSIKASTGTL